MTTALCPPWCGGGHDVEPDPFDGVHHTRIVDVIPVDDPEEAMGSPLVTVSICSIDYGAPHQPPVIVTTGPRRDQLDVDGARAYAQALLQAANELEVITAGQRGGELEQARLLEEWSAWMQAAGMSRRTIGSRLGLLAQVAAFAGTPAQDLSWRQLAAFLGRDLKATTRSTYYADLRAWFDWLTRMGHRGDDPTAKLHKPRQPRRQPRPITTPQLERVLQAANRRRTRTMVLLAAYQGLRVHEIAKIRGEDIVRDGMVVADPGGQLSTCDALRVHGKGGVEVLLPLHPIVAGEAEAYPSYGWWFPSYTSPTEPVKANSVTIVLSHLAERAGVDATAHQLRHWYGTQVLRAAGGNLRVAQELLRHANPAASAIYTQVDGAERRAALLALPRLDSVVPPPGAGHDERLAGVDQGEYVSGNDRMRPRDVGDGDVAIEPVGTFHAVPAAGVESYGRVRAVCGVTVEVVAGGTWPVSTPGRNPTCKGCERLAGT